MSKDYIDGDFREVDDEGNTLLTEDEIKHENIESSKSSGDEYEKCCYICRRPESQAGKMMTMPTGIDICPDCMQRTFDTLNDGGFMGGMPFGGMPLGGMPMGAFPMGGNPFVDKGNPEKPQEGEDGDKKANGFNLGSIPGIQMINFDDFQSMLGGPSKKVKKRKKGEKAEPVIDINKIPAPHKIKEKLDEYVVGQEQAKKIMSVAVYNHYKRVATNTMDEIEIEKSNMLMVGPTGCGKTYIVKTLAKLLDVPLAIADATSLTEAGYIGDDIESVLSKLLAAADNDVDRAECGIVFIDEIDKIAKKRNTNQRDVSGESVQQGMLKLLEGAEVEVPVGANSKNAMVPMTTIDTRNILFICGGAFPELDEIIKERLNKEASIGFKADLKDKYDDNPNIQLEVKVEDIRKFGMIPEFLGRLPILFAMESLSEDMLVRILEEPKNAIIKQYKKLLELDEVDLEFEPEALRAIARKAKEKDVGARALRAIIEEFMMDIMYEIPKDDNIGKVIITKEYVEKTGGPRIIMRGATALPEAEIPKIE